jgi:hypothetical protein
VASVLVLARAGEAQEQRKPDTPPPCTEAVKGRIVSVEPDGSGVTLERQGRTEKRPVAASAAAALKARKPGAQATLQLNCRANPPVVTGLTQVAQPQSTPKSGTTSSTQAGQRETTVLISSDDACELSIDFKPWGALAAGSRNELKLAPGEHLLEAKGPKGRVWEEKIKVGSDQLIVEVKLGPPTATVAEFDAQAGQLCSSLSALRRAGEELDAILRNNKYKFHKADSTDVSSATASWTREMAALKEMVAPPERKAAAADLAKLDATVRDYGDLLVKALQTAQEKNTIMGEAAALRDKAKGLVPQLRVAAETLKLLPGCGA